MPTFYLDENVSLKIVPFVQAAGHSVVTYLGEGLKGERDDVHLFTARRNAWILVTYNGSDFILLHDALQRWNVPNPHGGILVLPDNLPNHAEARARCMNGARRGVGSAARSRRHRYVHRRLYDSPR